jgi:hypothetical protein
MPQNVKPSEYKQLLRVLKKGLRVLNPEDLLPGSPCPDSWNLASYVTGEMTKGQQQEMNVHLAFCDACLEKYVALAGPEKIAEILSQEIWGGNLPEKTRSEPFKEEIASIRKRFEKHLGKGFQEVTNKWRRAARIAKSASEVLKVGQNTYSFGVSMKEGHVMCTVAALRTPVKVPLTISVRSETGTEVLSTRTDDSGNVQFVLPVTARDSSVLTVEVTGPGLRRRFTIDEKLKLHQRYSA